jgi:hypothetical protein
MGCRAYEIFALIRFPPMKRAVVLKISDAFDRHFSFSVHLEVCGTDDIILFDH